MTDATPATPATPATGSLVAAILSEGPISTAEVARLVGCRVHPATVTRWALTGIRLPDGRRVRLECARLGGRLITSKARLAAFIEAQSTARATEPVPPAASAPPRSPAARSRASQRAEAELIKAGC